MPSYINTNISSLNAQNNLNKSQTALQMSLQRLSSGLRINSAKDDAAGMAIVSRMSAQINGNMQAARNANDGISLSQTAEGDMSQIATNLQRMRDLAVQSANSTNSASDRAALNNEVQALAAEIDRVAQNSSFNGVKLLDGTFTAQNFQVGAGATAADQVAITSIASARTTLLGGANATSSATLTSGAVAGTLTAGALTLNGQQVAASVAGSAPGQSADSAYQIAAAINLVSPQSGVTAVANAHSVVGAAATAFTAIAANTFQINGINIGTVAAGGTAPGQGANVAAAINLVSTQTGVIASADAATGALTLTAADGRDIMIGMSGTASTTVAAAATLKTTFLTQTGLLSANVGAPGTNATAIAAVAPATPLATTGTMTLASVTASTIAAGLVTVNGTAMGAVSITGVPATDATALAAAINAALVATTGGAAVNGSVAASGAVITFTTGTGATPLTLAITGTAADATTAAANKAVLVAQMGIAAASLGGQASGGPVAGTPVDNHGTITLSSNNAAGIVVSGGTPALAGLTAGTTAAAGATFSSIASVDITTATGALNALSAIDGAITTINTSRAELGAYQNRFASIVSSLQTTTENLTASRSRIQDTDFAAETASLSRNQILQQAGTAMLAQANQLPSLVLNLLK
ncbi:MAG: flagellin [Gallionella sp.]